MKDLGVSIGYVVSWILAAVAVSYGWAAMVAVIRGDDVLAPFEGWLLFGVLAMAMAGWAYWRNREDR